MSKQKYPMTPALRTLKDAGVEFMVREYKYEEKGGTAVASRELKVPEHMVIKTLVMEDEAGKPLIVLMHGDKEVSTKSLARTLAVKSVTPCDTAVANRLTGYQVGGISPFGVRTAMPVYVQATILELERIIINGGKKGFLVEIDTKDLVRVLSPTPVDVAN